MLPERETIRPVSMAPIKSGTTNSFLLAETTCDTDPRKEPAKIRPPSSSRMSSNQVAMSILTSKKRTFSSEPPVTTYPFWYKISLIEFWRTRMILDARF